MCITTTRGEWIATEYDAREFLTARGFDRYDIEEFADLIQPEGYESIADRYDDLKQEFRSYELSLDAAHGLFNEVLTLCDELARRSRTKEGSP